MDEEITIIDSNTRNEKIRNFFINNTKNLVISFSFILILLVGLFTFNEIKERNKIKLANQFNLIVLQFKTVEKQKTITKLTSIVNKKDTTYSPLALYYLLDNKIIENNNEINILFDVLINETNLEKEIKNLIIYKKALYNSDTATENELLGMLNPIINSESIWKSHALYLMAEYFYSKTEKQKSKEFFNQILILRNPNSDIRVESQKRINRDFSE
jgi:predicted negative regulator of RcsB-dependent stress response